MKRFETEPRVKRDSVAEPLVEKQYEAEEEQALEEPVKDEELVKAPQTPTKPPVRERLLDWAPFLSVFLLGAILRFWGLGDKPLHHDESLHAYFSLQLLHNMECMVRSSSISSHLSIKFPNWWARQTMA
ncbi:MAG: hypothetical protein E6J04_00235 [Chloroflexi bacterium]|nr:MAG: hypothetical protein E6J04_00235 [Chloroflexota bacterium]